MKSVGFLYAQFVVMQTKQTQVQLGAYFSKLVNRKEVNG